MKKIKELLKRKEEIIHYLWNYPNLEWSETKDFHLIGAMKKLETIMAQLGNRNAAREIAEHIDKYHSYDEIVRRLDEKDGVFCNGHALVKTGKTFAKDYGKWADILYCENHQPLQSINVGTPTQPKLLHVANYWYTYMFSDEDTLRKDRLNVLFAAMGVSRTLRETIFQDLENLDSEFRMQMLGRLLSDCRYYTSEYGRNELTLWSRSVVKQVSNMKALYLSFGKLDCNRPSEETWEEILAYESKMLSIRYPYLKKALSEEHFSILYSLFPNELSELEEQTKGYQNGVRLFYPFVKNVLIENQFENWLINEITI